MAVDIIIEMSRDHVIKPSHNRSIRTTVTRLKLLLIDTYVEIINCTADAQISGTYAN